MSDRIASAPTDQPTDDHHATLTLSWAAWVDVTASLADRAERARRQAAAGDRHAADLQRLATDLERIRHEIRHALEHAADLQRHTN